MLDTVPARLSTTQAASESTAIPEGPRPTVWVAAWSEDGIHPRHQALVEGRDPTVPS